MDCNRVSGTSVRVFKSLCLKDVEFSVCSILYYALKTFEGAVLQLHTNVRTGCRREDGFTIMAEDRDGL